MRLEIARALLRINGPGDRTAAGILTRLVADLEPVGDRSLAMNVLLQASEETRNKAMLALGELLSHADLVVQPDVLASLGEAGPQARVALPVLEKLLEDPEPGTRGEPRVRGNPRESRARRRAPDLPQSCSKWLPTSR